MNEKAMGGTVDDIAKNISGFGKGSKFFQRLKPNLNDINETIAKRVNHNIKEVKLPQAKTKAGYESTKLYLEGVRDMANKFFERNGNKKRITEEMLQSALKDAKSLDFTSKTFDDDLHAFLKRQKNWNIDNDIHFNAIKGAYKDTFSRLEEEAGSYMMKGSTVHSSYTQNLGPVLGNIAYGSRVVDGYFRSGDFATSATRIGTAVGLVEGGALLHRTLSGGTLTKDEYGRKDIVGVPFI